jgi:alginate O-acetyltransferase complex protein AlgI
MLFPTITFAVFFLLAFVGNWLLMPKQRLWKPFMLLVSLVFYGWWDWRFVLLLALSAVANQFFAAWINGLRPGAGRKWALAAAVAANLGVLGWFKYYGFFVTSAADLLNTFGLNADLPLLRIILPIGISFLTFRVLSYVIDVYRGTLRPASLVDFSVYVAFFPYLAAGPIARASEFLPQLRGPRDPRNVDTSRAFFLIFGGLIKKMLIADYLATHIVNGVFTTPGQYSSLEVLVGIVGYAVQIYCDFSAYADIAIGISLLLGFELPDNFDAPYTARTIQDFWRRWHITLSSWLRDYLYIPLGGNRKGRGRTYANLVITFLLGGLWHGAGWTFVFWGLMHGTGLAAERARMDARHSEGLREPGATAGSRALQRLWVFAFVSVAWVFFRAESMGNAFAVLWRLIAGIGSLGTAVTLPVVGLAALGIAIQYVPRRATEGLEAGFSRIGWAGQGLVLALALFLIDVLGPAGAAEFLYFRF